MATPVYGKQYIRFAETALVPENKELKQFRLVAIDAAAATEPPTIGYAAGGDAFGVLQQDVLVKDDDRAVTFPRLGTVATSGLLLIESASGGSEQAIGSALKVDATGISSDAGSAVTVNGTSPIVRQQVMIGGIATVLASFN